MICFAVIQAQGGNARFKSMVYYSIVLEIPNALDLVSSIVQEGLGDWLQGRVSMYSLFRSIPRQRRERSTRDATF